MGPLGWPGYQWKYVVYGIGGSSGFLYKSEVVVTFENPLYAVLSENPSIEVLSKDRSFDVKLALGIYSSTPITFESVDEYIKGLGSEDYFLNRTYTSDELKELLGGLSFSGLEWKEFTIHYDLATIRFSRPDERGGNREAIQSNRISVF